MRSLSILWKREDGIINKVDKASLWKNPSHAGIWSDEWTTGEHALVALLVLTVAEYYRDGDLSDPKRWPWYLILFLSIIYIPFYSSGFLKFLHFLVVCLRQWVTNRHLLQKWVSCKSALRLLNEDPLHLQAVYVPADDLTDPAPATTFAHLDATTVLSRKIASLGIYPVVDPLDSTSRILIHTSLVKNINRCAQRVKNILQRYNELQDIIAILGMEELSRKTNWSYPVQCRVQRFLSTTIFCRRTILRV